MKSAISLNAIVFSHEDRDEGSTSRLRLASSNVAQKGRRSTPSHLTPRQLEVLALLCEGLPNKLICRRLNISAGTVKAHISCILKGLGVTSRLQAVVVVRSHGFIGKLPEHGKEGHNGTPRAMDFSPRVTPGIFDQHT